MNSIGDLLRSFLTDYLPIQKGLRPSSIKSYRDVMRIYLQYAAQKTNCRITKLGPQHFSVEVISGFLAWLEESRKSSIRTRNHRLAVLHCFCEYMASRLPDFVAEAQRVALIQSKRCSPPETFFLEQNEVDQVFQNLSADKKDRLSMRDRAILLFMYNTGARVQEVADLRLDQVDLNARRVRLYGKGGKWRTCPLWKETVAVLRQLLADTDYQPGTPVFCSRKHQPLTRFGIYKIVRKCTKAVQKKRVDGTPKAISPHIFRHTTAVHLVESGVEVNVIRAWLGHVSLETTNRYAEINMRMKEAALEACRPPTSNATSHTYARWREDADLLKWLSSL